MRAYIIVLRFLFTGAINTAVGYASFLLIYSLVDTLFTVASISTSVVMSLVISLAFSYQMQKRFVWKEEKIGNRSSISMESPTRIGLNEKRNSPQRQRRVYTTYYLSVAALNIASVRLLKQFLSVDPRVGQAIFTLISSFISFFFLRRLFSKIER